MEFDDVSEEIEWEARRVVAAFGVEKLVKFRFVKTPFYKGVVGEYRCFFRLHETNLRWANIILVTNSTQTNVGLDDSGMLTFYNDETSIFNDHLARGLYCLGFEDESALASNPLTAHEKLELRLSMPREFSPQKWLDEAQDK